MAGTSSLKRFRGSWLHVASEHRVEMKRQSKKRHISIRRTFRRGCQALSGGLSENARKSQNKKAAVCQGGFGIIPQQVARARSRMRLFPGSPSYLTSTSEKSGVPGKGGGWRRGRKLLSSHRVRNEAPITRWNG